MGNLLKKKVWLSLGVVLVVGGIGYGISRFQLHQLMNQAEGQLQKGFGALAAETVDPYRATLVKQEKGCALVVNAYRQARRADRLEWAAQACLEAGREIPDAYLGLASAYELMGRDNNAVQVLNVAMKKFDKNPDPFYALANIMRRNKNNDTAVAAYRKTMELAPNNAQLALEALDYFSSLQRWDVAREVADKLKAVQTDSPEVKLFVARALIKGGDQGSAKTLVSQVQDMLGKNPQNKPALEKAYADVFAVSDSAAGRNLASDSKK